MSFLVKNKKYKYLVISVILLFFILIPNAFANKTESSDSEKKVIEYATRLMQLSDNYLYEEKIDSCLMMADSALHYTLTIHDPFQKAQLFQLYGKRQRHIGDKRLGHHYLYEAIDLYNTLEGCEAEISHCYSKISSDYFFFNDLEALIIMRSEIENLVNKNPQPSVCYDYYTIKASCFYMDYVNTNFALSVDSAIFFYNKAVEYANCNHSEIACHDLFYNYYKLALCYLLSDTNPDSKVLFYIDCMENVKNKDYMEVEINVGIQYLKMLLYLNHNQYKLAEEEIVKGMNFIARTQRNSLSNFQNNFYYFLAIIYYEYGDYKKAIDYFLQYDENFTKKIVQDKHDALINLKFQMERLDKEQQIDLLNQKNRASKIIISIMLLLILAAIFSLIMLIRYNRLKRRNLEQNVYENFLVSEMQREELMKRNEEMQSLQKEYDRILSLSKRNQNNALKYKEKLDQLQEKMKQSRTQMVLKKLELSIQDSIIFSDTKKSYLARLEKINVVDIEKKLTLATDKITNLDIRYILCFTIDMELKDVSLLFNVEVDSIYTVRCRLKKKLGNDLLIS